MCQIWRFSIGSIGFPPPPRDTTSSCAEAVLRSRLNLGAAAGGAVPPNSRPRLNCLPPDDEDEPARGTYVVRVPVPGPMAASRVPSGVWATYAVMPSSVCIPYDTTFIMNHHGGAAEFLSYYRRSGVTSTSNANHMYNDRPHIVVF